MNSKEGREEGAENENCARGGDRVEDVGREERMHSEG